MATKKSVPSSLAANRLAASIKPAVERKRARRKPATTEANTAAPTTAPLAEMFSQAALAQGALTGQLEQMQRWMERIDATMAASKAPEPDRPVKGRTSDPYFDAEHTFRHVLAMAHMDTLGELLSPPEAPVSAEVIRFMQVYFERLAPRMDRYLAAGATRYLKERGMPLNKISGAIQDARWNRLKKERSAAAEREAAEIVTEAERKAAAEQKAVAERKAAIPAAKARKRPHR
jgi:hypothetical protein